MPNLSREDSLLTLSGTAALTKWVCCRGKLLWTVWVQNTCENLWTWASWDATNRIESLRLFASKAWWPKWTTGLSRIRPGYATIAFGSKHLGKFWQKSCPTRTWNNMKQLHRYGAHAETLQEVYRSLRHRNFYLQHEVSNYAPVAIELLDEQIEERWMRPGHRVLASWWWWCYFVDCSKAM